ncbi:unnamed protein product [Tuber aestivum]|uniref:Uncharacterized protein n=1 Tax=Tuber aestivum TaxID=59557 RepID=A0A292Q8V8_9PEZI|nr:unnamed protein product [Tuber aestivum]
MPTEPNQPNPAIGTANSEAGRKAPDSEHETPCPEVNTVFLARAMAHISSPSFIPPVPIEHLESILLFVAATTSGGEGPLIVRVATDEDCNESRPLCLLVKYPMVRSVGDVNHSWCGFEEFLAAGMASGLGESVAEASNNDLGSARPEGTSSWVRAQGVEEDPIVYGDEELSEEWWSMGQGRLLAMKKDKEVSSNGIGAPQGIWGDKMVSRILTWGG